MPDTHLVVETTVPRSFRTDQIASMFDVPLVEKVHQAWDVHLPIEAAPWQIGLIVGPSGCGKSTLARHLWPDAYTRGYTWNDRSVLDNFPTALSSTAIVSLLTAVGFSSPPDWVKPYHALSTGQQMRCDLARALTSAALVVFDEFTSVVDRTVAQIGSASIAKAIRRQSDRQFIAVTCHNDVAEWLEPDWVYEPATDTFSRRRLRRPSIDFAFVRCHPSAWTTFRHAHYLSHDLNPVAVCYALTRQNQPVAFAAVLGMIGYKGCYRVSRIVVLPDFQGIGIGSRFMDAVGALYQGQGKRLRITTAHPGFLTHLDRSTAWTLCSQSSTGNKRHGGRKNTSTVSSGRGVATFEYRGPPQP